MNVAMKQPIRDGEHFHDPSAHGRLRQGALIRARHVSNLGFALKNFHQDELADVLAKALQDVLGSKGKAFNVLDAAMKEVMK